MGRLKQRLERRKQPLFPQAKEMARLAVAAAQGDEEQEYELDEMVEGYLEDLGPEEFEQLLALAREEVQMYDEGEAGDEMLLATVRHVATFHEDHDCEEQAYLFALPLVLSAEIPERPLFSEELCDELKQVLLEHDLIDEDCSIELLPRLVAPAEVEALRHGDLFALTRTLWGAEGEAAMALLSRLRVDSRGSGTVHRIDGSTQGLGLLVGVAVTAGGLPFVLSRIAQDEHEALHAQDGLSVQENARAHAELAQELDAELQQAQGPLASALDVQAVDILSPADRWHEIATVLLDHHRTVRTDDALRGLAREHCGGNLDSLALQPPETQPGLLRFPVERKADKAVIGTVDWPRLPQEDARHTLLRFIALMDELHVEPHFEASPEAAPDGPLH